MVMVIHRGSNYQHSNLEISWEYEETNGIFFGHTVIHWKFHQHCGNMSTVMGKTPEIDRRTGWILRFFDTRKGAKSRHFWNGLVAVVLPNGFLFLESQPTSISKKRGSVLKHQTSFPKHCENTYVFFPWIGQSSNWYRQASEFYLWTLGQTL